MRDQCVLTAAIAGLAVSVASAGVVPATVLIQEGNTVSGQAVTGLGAPYTNGNGEVGYLATLDNGDRAVMLGTTPLFVSSDALPTVLSGGETTIGIGDNGEFIYSPSVDGADAVWGEDGLIAVEETPSPTGPAGFNTTFHSRPRMIDDGSAYWVSALNDGAGGTSSQNRLIYFRDGATDAISVLLAGGDVIDGVTVEVGSSGIDFDTALSDDGAIGMFLFEDNATGTTCLAVGGTIVAREEAPTGDGDNWDNFDHTDVSTTGNYVFSGDTDGSSATDEFVAYNGVIQFRESDTALGGTLDGSVDAVSISNNGAAAFIWEFDDGTGLEEALFYASDASDMAGTLALVVRVGDMIDTDGDGSGDLTVTDFNAGIGVGIDLAGDGLIHVELDVEDNDGVETEAIVTFDMNTGGPCNDADIAEPFGVLDLGDVNLFVSAFLAMEEPADIAAPFGVWDLADVSTFINAFNTGCP